MGKMLNTKSEKKILDLENNLFLLWHFHFAPQLEISQFAHFTTYSIVIIDPLVFFRFVTSMILLICEVRFCLTKTLLSSKHLKLILFDPNVLA